MNKIKLLLLLCIAIPMCMSGQDFESIFKTVPSPNAMSLGVYGEVPVSLNTGIPNISIPLYSVKDKNFNFDVSLSYYSAGVRPSTHAGWVGDSWSLNCGGVITREIRNIEDELADYGEGKIGYYYSGKNKSSDWSENLDGFDGSAANKDREPDLFSFNFLGFSGEFYLDHNRNWQVRSDHNLKVEFNGVFVKPFIAGTSYGLKHENSIIPHFENFIITDGYGNRYIFGGKNAVEYTEFMFPEILGLRGVEFRATSWFLKRIEVYSSGEIIDFEYKRGPYTAQLYNVVQESKSSADNSTGVTFYKCKGDSGRRYYVTGNSISPVYLNSVNIKNRDITIGFNTFRDNSLHYRDEDYLFACNFFKDMISTGYLELFTLLRESEVPSGNNVIANLFNGYKLFGWLYLSDFTIKHKDKQIKKYDLHYTTSGSQNRYFLNTLTEYGSNVGNNKVNRGKRYTFEYDFKGYLYHYLKTHTDHWGFNNSSYFKPEDSDFLRERAVDSTQSKYGILKKIIYPTGGSTEFKYEQNRYRSFVSDDRSKLYDETEDKLAGGLRIKKIINNDGKGNISSKQYFYIKDYSPENNCKESSGILNVKPKYNYEFSAGGKSYIVENNNPVIPVSSTSSGDYIMYSEVTEKLNDGSYTVYKFTDNRTNRDDKAIRTHNIGFTPVTPFSSRKQERGKLLSEIKYDKSGIIVSRTDNEYIKVGNKTNPVRAISINGVKFCGNGDNELLCLSAYYRYNYSYLLSKTSVTNYFNGNSTPFTTDSVILKYDISNNKKPTTIITKRNGEERNITKYIFPVGGMKTDFFDDDLNTGGETNIEDIIVNDFDYSDNPVFTKTFKDNIKNIPFETIIEREINGKLYVIDAEFIEYGIGTNDRLRLKTNWKYESGILKETESYNISEWLVNSESLFRIDKNLKPKVYIDKYDDNGNILQYHKVDEDPVATVWGYNNIYPIIRAEGITYSSLVSEINKKGKSLSWIEDSIIDNEKTVIDFVNTLRNDLSDVAITSYTYKPDVGVSSITDINGKTTYYTYNYIGGLKRVIDYNNNILADYSYHYAGNKYDEVSQTGHYVSTFVEGSGKISPEGNVNIEHGGEFSFNISAGLGYELSDIIVDSGQANKRHVKNEIDDISKLTSYTVTNICNTTHIKILFAKRRYNVCVNNNILQNVINCSEVEHGEPFEVEFSEYSSGFRFKEIIVNGNSAGADRRFRESSVSENTNITAVYDIVPVSGSVSDQFGNPLNGVKIETYQKYEAFGGGIEYRVKETVYTDANGKFNLTGDYPAVYNHIDRPYYFRITKEGILFAESEQISVSGIRIYSFTGKINRVDKSSITLNESGLVPVPINLQANGSWNITGKSEWLNISVTNGVGDAVINVTSTPNTEEDMRYGEFTINIGTQRFVVNVSQKAIEPIVIPPGGGFENPVNN